MESIGSLPDSPLTFRTGKDGEAVVFEFRVPIIAVQGQPAGGSGLSGRRAQMRREMRKYVFWAKVTLANIE